MTSAWNDQFRRRTRHFVAGRPNGPGELAVSIKIRAASGCFHRQHSPHAYEIINSNLHAIHEEDHCLDFVEHETGPELLVFVAVTTAAITLAKSAVDLVVAIIKARSEGVKRGDRPSEPLEIIVRRSERDGEYLEERILRIGHRDPVNEGEMEDLLKRALGKLCARNTPDDTDDH